MMQKGTGMKKFWITAIAAWTLTAALTAAPAMADTIIDPTINDVHCLVVYLKVESSQQTAVQQTGMLGSFYFLGKLDGRADKRDLTKLLLTETPRMTGALLKSEVARCGVEMDKRADAAGTMFAAIQLRQAEKPAAVKRK
jgi:hypothetical protein